MVLQSYEVAGKAVGKNYKQLKKIILCRFYVISMAVRLLNTNSRIFQPARHQT